MSFIVLSLDFLIANKEATAAKTHQIMKTTELNQPTLFLKCFDLWKSKGVFLWGRGLFLFPQEIRSYRFIPG